MWFLDLIVTYCNNISSFFYSLYLEVRSWWIPASYSAVIFLQLSWMFSYLAWDFYYFNQWVDSTARKLLDILSWSTIKSFILSWLPSLQDAVNWFLARLSWFTTEVTNWWNGTKAIVQGWIDTAKQFLQTQINSLSTLLANLQAAWNEWQLKIPSFNEIWSWFTNWWNNTLARIITWGALTALQINTLIDSNIKSWFPFYESLSQLWSKVAEFITDPLTWLEKRFTDWFLGAG